MRFLIVTPTMNRHDYLAQTIDSVVTQTGDFEIDYIVQDGGSTNPRIFEIIESFAKRLVDDPTLVRCRQVDFRWFSAADSGMYDAIRRGFADGHGDVMYWINSDDMLHPYALRTVAEVFEAFPDVNWLTGIPNSYNARGSRVGFDTWPPAYSRAYLEAGYYQARFADHGFNWIQQESTFWRSSLWAETDLGCFSRYKYAADYYLWRAFAQRTDLVRVTSMLGGYRVHPNQITANPGVYDNEINPALQPPAALRDIVQMFRDMPWLKRHLFGDPRRATDFFAQRGLRLDALTGRVVRWSFDTTRWVIDWQEIFT